jgi:hypothetical protein
MTTVEAPLVLPKVNFGAGTNPLEEEATNEELKPDEEGFINGAFLFLLSEVVLGNENNFVGTGDNE